MRVKTYREFAETCLTPPQRKRYYDNLQKSPDNRPTANRLTITQRPALYPTNPCYHLTCSFYYSDTPEGIAYWRDISISLRDYEAYTE